MGIFLRVSRMKSHEKMRGMIGFRDKSKIYKRSRKNLGPKFPKILRINPKITKNTVWGFGIL